MGQCFVLLILITHVMGDFVYRDFNETTGLIFNGDTGTTSCSEYPQRDYGDVQRDADRFNENVFIERGEDTDLTSESTVQTNKAMFNAEIEQYLAGYLHRNDTISAPRNCSNRIRLTPSGPSKIGSVWFRDKFAVYRGFDTYFTFQISDHSKECTLHRDQYMSAIHHRTCAVRGGDGFAFVIHNDPNNTAAIGQAGGQMGFGGLRQSLAIAFDTWSNPGEDQLAVDHISIQSRGPLAANDGLEVGLLGLPRPHDLADGKIHLARVAYFNDIRPEYLKYLVASDSLLPFLNDNGEQKRIGMLAVFIDDGVAADIPILAMPINLSLLLKLPDDEAFVGFTSSTGRFYEKHDILNWHFCASQPCTQALKQEFDYHQHSKFSSVPLTRNEEGKGFGGGDTEGFPTHNTSPDTTPWEEPLRHFSTGRNHGLAADVSSQTPPNTIVSEAAGDLSYLFAKLCGSHFAAVSIGVVVSEIGVTGGVLLPKKEKNLNTQNRWNRKLIAPVPNRSIEFIAEDSFDTYNLRSSYVCFSHIWATKLYGHFEKNL
eukprot:gene1604-3096_t